VRHSGRGDCLNWLRVWNCLTLYGLIMRHLSAGLYPLMLADGEIHLWSSGVHKPEAIQTALYRKLSLDERGKAARFRFDEHRNAYIVARGLLRLILSHYVGIEPEQLHFTYGPRGKPALRDSDLYFSASHSEGLVVYALARQPQLGIDVEYVRPIATLEVIAKQFFSAAEYDDLLTLNRSKRREGFFNCWTRKEAYVKAVGDGLYTPLDQFQVTLKPNQPATFVTIQGDQTLAARWSLFDWKPREQYSGAIAVCGTGWHLEEKSMAVIGL
jgi:4'-phosphopantetheinyl transferase